MKNIEKTIISTVDRKRYNVERNYRLVPGLLSFDNDYILRLVRNPFSYVNCAADVLVKVNDIDGPKKHLTVLNLAPKLETIVKLSLLPVTPDGEVINELEKYTVNTNGILVDQKLIGQPREIGYLLSSVDESDFALQSLLEGTLSHIKEPPLS